MATLDELVIRARAGSLEAYGRRVEATQRMAYAVALGVVRNPSMAEDATQEAYLRASGGSATSTNPRRSSRGSGGS